MEVTQLIDGRWPWVFQVDSELVRQVYEQQDNYLIEYDDTVPVKDICAIYFSSNDIYYPNEENVFRKRIIERNAFEWYGTRINNAYKHIFLRDIFKQWYLKGINSQQNSPTELLALLKKETEGLSVVAVGSSAGGYAAILFGVLLQAKRVLAFNPQFEIKSLLKSTTAEKNPLLFRLRNTEWSRYFDLKEICNFELTDVYYFHSSKSEWDNEEWEYVSDCSSIHHLTFNTSHHGIPFLKIALSKVLNSEKSELLKYENKAINPILFAIQQVGLISVLVGIASQIRDRYARRR